MTIIRRALKKRMNKPFEAPCNRSRLTVTGITLALSVGVLVSTSFSGARAQQKTPITVGSITTWTPGGEIYDVLCRTNIFELNGFDAKCRGFSYAPPLGEALLGGLIDNAFGADSPVIRMAARVPGTKILHRTTDWVFGILVRPDFPGKDLASLRGARLSGPFVTGTFMSSMLKLIDAGIKDPFKDLKLINQDLSDQPLALASGQVDAVTTWHPMFKKLVDTGAARVLWAAKQGDGLGIQGLSGPWLAKYGEEGAVRFLKAWIMAVWWTSNNIEQANEWFAETSGFPVEYVKAGPEGDRYLRAPHKNINDMTFELLPGEIKEMQRVMDYLYTRNLITEKVDVAAMVDDSFILRAQREIREGKHPSLSDIKPVENLYIK
ncbi:ABC-type nitrate/sulfonate/bicarbonate transport systems, periplasmic components [Hyphomicrobiales bacterium]|uniref:ABC transporter substrate-binding protein n=2 Tax=Chelatococcaceae TaxID=2036754 RepID=UPI00224BC69A|nr:ABC transporter substrate-binding protein [Chelatococcus asaccharovorans]CAH1693325.1 ABC-type nitrate/sulfonate/bicarbonate transport systems, periplasmic components [Hyphomicrobiales bacterium]CAH1657156.1 ABC-type nitrate/sulfonate/bicarbonate transport systems, periplasmic components [Chelatococcus asaccharovorans]CAH1695208.1 ABC-type nitrate/sulfonate/bicarbonate transport systems, periplasmic components [Chelatococcus asaccharovorans]CAH1696704.1 ABC-type nitrate/sulfonate/bicarbonate